MPVERRPDGTLKKGSVLNPKGRPKDGESLSSLVRMGLDKEIEPGKTVLDELFEIAIKKAKQGDFHYFEWIFNRAYGKALDRLEVSTKEPFIASWGNAEEEESDESYISEGEVITPESD